MTEVSSADLRKAPGMLIELDCPCDLTELNFLFDYIPFKFVLAILCAQECAQFFYEMLHTNGGLFKYITFTAGYKKAQDSGLV
jgi:hypothetical protein